MQTTRSLCILPEHSLPVDEETLSEVGEPGEPPLAARHADVGVLLAAVGRLPLVEAGGVHDHAVEGGVATVLVLRAAAVTLRGRMRACDILTISLEVGVRYMWLSHGPIVQSWFVQYRLANFEN